MSRSRSALVVVIDPDGEPTNGIACKDEREVLTVVLETSREAKPLTIMNVYDMKTREPIDRWGIGSDGRLVHSPYCK